MNNLGTDELIEDAFGLNVRGLRTISDMFIRPAKVFQAARAKDWDGRYTPSLRLVFSILALLGFFSFFWAGEDSVFFREFSTRLAESDELMLADEEQRNETVNRLLGVYSAVVPIAYILGHGFMSLFFRIWGANVGRVERLRLHLAAIVPSMTFTLLATLLIPVLPQSLFGVVSIAMILGTSSLDFITSFRGGVAGTKIMQRTGRSALFALSAILGSLIASILSFGIPTFFLTP